MKTKEWVTLIILMVVIAAVVAYFTGAITGNVIKVDTSKNKKASEVYTKAEVDSLVTTGVLNMLNTKCSIWSVAVPNASREVSGDDICKERNAGTCILMINYNRLSSNDMIQKCTPYVTGTSDKTVAYCCSP